MRGHRDRDNQKLFLPPVTDVLNMLPQASAQAKVVSLYLLFMSLGASGEMEKRFFFFCLPALETHPIFAEELREMKRLSWGHLTVGRGDTVGPGFRW